jgi:hypothetical protein
LLKKGFFKGWLSSNENSINCADINSGFLLPVTYNNKVYTNSIGGYSNLSKKVVEFDLFNNKYTTYEIHTGIFSVAATNNYIFTSNSPAHGSIITKYNINKESVEGTLEVPGLVQHINIIKNLLYAFSDSDDRDGSIIISVINPNTLKIEKSIHMKSDISIFYSINVDNFIFFTHMMAGDDKTPSKILSRMNINDGTITNIQLSEDYPNQIIKYKDSLLITHYNAQTNTGNKLTILNLITNKQKIVSFNHTLKQIEVNNDKLYACDDTNMYIYDLGNYQLLDKFEIKADRKNYRITGFFFTK